MRRRRWSLARPLARPLALPLPVLQDSGGGGGGGFNPSLYGTVHTWYDPTRGTYQDDGGASPTTPAIASDDVVGTWQDQSGNAHHATQATDASKLVLQLNVQNGMPVLRGDGSNTLVSAAFTALAARTLVVVAKWDSGATFDVAIDGDAATRESGLSSDNLGWTIDAGTPVANLGTLDTNFHIFVWYIPTSGDSILRIDGAAVTTSAAGNEQPTAWRVGSRYDGNAGIDGDLGDIIPFEGALTDTAGLEAALASRWTITLNP